MNRRGTKIESLLTKMKEPCPKTLKALKGLNSNEVRTAIENYNKSVQEQLKEQLDVDEETLKE